jgi:hypothetical protein
MDMLNKGFTRGLSWLFGEQATAIVSGLFVPMWFMEGDAVCTETAISHSGRGRIPSFEMEIRSQMLQKGMFSYDKAVFGSYRDFIPDQYVLGYQIVANTRRRFGSAIVDQRNGYGCPAALQDSAAGCRTEKSYRNE